MSCEESIKCVRPLIYELDDSADQSLVEDYPYWMKGTSFVVRHLDEYYIVTARHVLKNQVTHNEDPTAIRNQVRIFYTEGSRDFLPLDTYLEIRGDEECYKDLSVFRVAKNLLDKEQIPYLFPIKIDDIKQSIDNPLELRADMPLLVRGYPSQINYVDYDRTRIRPRSVTIRGRLSGANGQKFLYRLHWNPHEISYIESDPEITGTFNPDGLSGAPVFSLEGCNFLGVLIMGSRSIGHFIDGRFIYRIIDEFLSNKHK